MNGVNSVSLKGRRESNEDKHTIILNEDGKNASFINANYLAVYDGHGGKFVSKFLSEYLPPLFMKREVVYPLTKNYILEMYKNTQEELKTKHKNNAMHCGSTCLVMIHYKYLKDGKYYINLMNTGDSRAIICRDNLAIPLCKDHKPHWPEERNRIQELGGNIYFDGDDYRIKDLSVSRAMGDIEAEPYVSYVPDIYRYRLEKNDKFIVLACDGLWDKLSNQEVANFILTECYDGTTNARINKETNVAKKLGEYAIQRGSTDNITIIIVFFDQT
ncbi:MAG: serine/threonine protein phosphatase [Hyperionvirus sp.]|uniref:Serine/threonine protein phosphatase n=1 Tax=Hyperionvirus sp. TaxID=2487770 RepID=A0A3G5ACE1_9VIRU|nr:MAG: serine/threonine protein phosphatase [Hyperionvirus sp.]